MTDGLPSPPLSSTIAAVATGPAAGGVGIIRISGPLALAVGRSLAREVPAEPEPRRAYFCDLCDRAGRTLDQGLFLWFRAPASFTGEDVVELHSHGGVRLLQLLLGEVLASGEVRPARPGEFSRRAYLNGRLDLTRAEAVAALVAAESEAAVRAAAAQLGGALASRLEALKVPLLALLTDLEGVLNFPDEAEGADAELVPRLAPLVAQGAALLRDAERGGLLRRGAKVVLFGPVNAGKSTLFNRLVGAPRALVDEEPGTTRDVLEARVEVGGWSWTLVDTAGLREDPGRLEARGIDLAREAVWSADVAVLVLPPGVTAPEVAVWRAFAGQRVRLVEVLGKADTVEPLHDRRGPLPEGERARSASGAHQGPLPVGEGAPLRVSGLTGEGVEQLSRELTSLLGAEGDDRVGAAAFVSESGLDALRRCEAALVRGLEAAQVATVEAVAGELALALDALGELTSERPRDEVLDALFRRFCIGK